MYRIPNVGCEYTPYIEGYCFHSVSQDKEYLIYFPEEYFTKLYSSVPGQITRESPFGDKLYTIAKLGPTKWLELGTWNGLGTTKCILDGFAERMSDQPILASLEIDPVLFNSAEINLKYHPARSCVTFHKGKLSSASTLSTAVFPEPENLEVSDRTSPHFFIHYDRERSLYNTASPFIPDFSPEVAVLDGGEYSGYLDWVNLDKSNLLYLCLDDTNTTKNKKVIEDLGSAWKYITGGDDRNGWAIYRRL